MIKKDIYERALKVIEDDNKRMAYAFTANRLKIIKYENAFVDILKILEDKNISENQIKKLIKNITESALKEEKI